MRPRSRRARRRLRRPPEGTIRDFHAPEPNRRGMVEYDVHHHLESDAMGGGQESSKIVDRPQRRIDGAVIGNGIGAPQLSLPRLHPDRVDRRQTDPVTAHGSDPRKARNRRREGALRGEIPQKYLVNGARLVDHTSISFSRMVLYISFARNGLLLGQLNRSCYFPASIRPEKHSRQLRPICR